MKTAAVIGASGLIGGNLLKIMTADLDFESIRVIARRPLPGDHPKVKVVVIDFSDSAAYRQALAGCDAVFCAVGTTRKKVKGDKTAYRKADYDIPVTAAKICAESGIPQFLLVSSIGADSGSSNFYLKLKGEVEESVHELTISSVSIFRPSMLLGKRKESRPAESFAQRIMRFLSFLIPEKYKPIEAKQVAKAMVAVSKMNHPGFKIYFYREMMLMC